MAKELTQEQRQAVITTKAVQLDQDLRLAMQEHNLGLQRRINSLRNQGMTDRLIFQTLDADFKAVSARGKRGGPIFRKLFKDVEKGIQERIKDVESTIYHHRAGILNLVVNEAGQIEAQASDELLIWICALGSAGLGGPTCPDCLERNGAEDTFANWTSRGLPVSGFSRCDDNCNCRLVPKKRVGRPIDTKKPLRLAARKVRVKTGDIQRLARKKKPSRKDRAALRALGSAKNKKENIRLSEAFKEKF